MNRLAKSGRRYTIDDIVVPSVTTIVGTLDKSGPLKAWAARECADYAVEHWDDLADMPLMERHNLIRTAPTRSLSSKAGRGTRIHALADRIARDEAVDVPDDLRGPVDAYVDFLDRWKIETITTETAVAHPGYMYAGTLDAIVTAPKLGTILLDIKTGNVYADVALQLAGYRYATVRQVRTEVVGPRGGKRPPEITEEPMINVDAAYVAHVGPDTVDLIPVDTGDTIFATFLYLREVWDFTHRVDRQGENRSTLGQPIFPEEYADAAAG